MRNQIVFVVIFVLVAGATLWYNQLNIYGFNNIDSELSGLPDVSNEFLVNFKTSVANIFKIDIRDIEITSIEPKEWSNSCLDLAGKGAQFEFCAAVMTPGYEIKFNANGQGYTSRTNLDATIIR